MRHQVGDTRHLLTHVLLVSTLAPRGLWKQPAGRGMSKHAQSITRAHQAHAGAGMLQAKHCEEALGGSDNTAPSQGPEGYLFTAIPSSAPHVFLISRAVPQAQFGPG